MQTLTPELTIMSCLTCTTDPRGEGAAPAIGTCAYCGAAACLDHARIVPVPTQQIGLAPQPAGARRIVCGVCARTL